ncbi:MAG: Polysaccharide deacetylase [Bryobacterales bacterium]|nr:Polysaccharide deacetylase [Bryobacterales bacterium]
MQTDNTGAFWPRGAQPESGAESPLPKIDPKYPDIAATKWHQYGFKEGLPRLLEMFDRRNVKVTSHVVGAAVEKHPALAKEIVQRGHKPSGHGQPRTPQYSMTPEQERKSYADSAATIERVTGVYYIDDIGQRPRPYRRPALPYASVRGFYTLRAVAPGRHLHAQGRYRELRDHKPAHRPRGDTRVPNE